MAGPVRRVQIGYGAGRGPIPTVENLSSSITLNSITESAYLCYNGKDAVTATWPSWWAGDTLTPSGAILNHASSPLLVGSRDGSAIAAGGLTNCVAADSSFADISNEDVVIEVIWLATVDPLLTSFGHKMNDAFTLGWYTGQFLSVGGNPYVTFWGLNGYYAPVSSADLTEDWHHAMLIWDRPLAQWYVDGARSGAAKSEAPSSTSLVTPQAFRIGTHIAATSWTSGDLALFAMWKRAAWLDTHQPDAFVAARYQALTLGGTL